MFLFDLKPNHKHIPNPIVRKHEEMAAWKRDQSCKSEKNKQYSLITSLLEVA
jgi:hypothetical protein